MRGVTFIAAVFRLGRQRKRREGEELEKLGVGITVQNKKAGCWLLRWIIFLSEALFGFLTTWWVCKASGKFRRDSYLTTKSPYGNFVGHPRYGLFSSPCAFRVYSAGCHECRNWGYVSFSLGRGEKGKASRPGEIDTGANLCWISQDRGLTCRVYVLSITSDLGTMPPHLNSFGLYDIILQIMPLDFSSLVH